MRFLVLLFLFATAICAQRINNETYQDVPIVLVDEIILRDFLNANGEPNDPFIAALWDPSTGLVYTWTNGPTFSPIVYRMNYRDLLNNPTQATFAFQNTTFVSASEYSVETGVYLPNRGELIMAGSRSLYRFPFARSDLTQVDNSFIFMDFVLPFTSYSYGDMMWIPQFRGPAGDAPSLIGVDWNLFSQGEAKSIKNLLSIEQMTSAYVSNNLTAVFLGSRAGIIQIRRVDVTAQPLLAQLTVNNSRIGPFAYDSIHSQLFVCVEVGSGVDVLRLDMPDPTLWNGAFLDVDAPDPRWSFESTHLLNIGACKDIDIDIEVGVAYVAIADSTGIGFLAKLNMKTMESLIIYIPIQREDSSLIAIHMETAVDGRRLLYGISTYSIAVWEYTTSCSQDCNFNATNSVDSQGQCVYGQCQCATQWWGLACATAACFPPCGDYDFPFRGECIQGQCVCQPRWTGSGCTEKRCPNDCLGNGNCNITANYTCECIDIRKGDDCSVLKFLTCDSVNQYNGSFQSSKESACLDLNPFLGCGFCGNSHQLCIDGNRQGPTVDSCNFWFYDGPWNPAFIVFICVMMASWGLMFIANAYSMLKEDLGYAKLRTKSGSTSYYGTKGYQKTLWWRDERSHKAWKMFDQMQFLAAYGIINAIYTTKLYNFLAFWNFSLFIIPLGGTFYDTSDHPQRALNYTPPQPASFPFPPIPPGAWSGGPVNATGRKRDYQQFINSQETPAQLIYPTAVIWFLITFFGFLILYGIYYAIMVMVMHKDESEYEKILGLRFKHIMTRVLNAFYFPAIFLAVFAIQVEFGHSEMDVEIQYSQAIIVLPIFMGLFVGLGVPAFFAFGVANSSYTNWFSPEFRVPYGAFYVPFKKDHIRFPLWIYLRKAFAACALAAMARGYDPDSEGIFWAQIIVTLFAYVIYLVVLVWKRPYIDVIHMIVDGLLALLDLITILLSLLAIQSDSGTQDAVQWIVLVVQIPCMFVVIVAYGWSTMFYAGYTSPRQFFCCEEKPKLLAEGDDALFEEKGKDGEGGGGAATSKPNMGPSDYGSDEDLDTIALPPENDG